MPISSSAEHSNVRGAVIPNDELQVAAVFETKQKAQQTLTMVQNNADVDLSQVELIQGNDPRFSEKLERDSRLIGQRLWSSHLLLGTFGLVQGLIVAYLLTQYGPAFTQQNPVFTYIALISPGIFIGLFVAGLISLRPDRDELVQSVKHAIRYGKVALIINLRKTQSAKDVVSVLKRHSTKVVESAR
ncbi:hypothetical protein D210916BOD24_13720 [Alteromonas sp. D210916BOD_24]|uniref:hypothetical protein n=1 Tax=Alteromonas sp. D210916BOD_24 TaxID=3157618 RepID=UPI00399CEE14